MSYSGKTNWQFDEVVKEADLNRIEQGVLDAHAGVETAKSEAKAYTDEKVAGVTPGVIGAVKKSDFDAHTADAGLHVTAAKQAAWDAKETPAGAQAKADQAEVNAKNVSLPRTGGILTGNLGVDTTQSPAISLAIGDNDTGFDWTKDGEFKVMANNVQVGIVNSSQVTIHRPLIVEGVNLKQSVSDGKNQIASAITGKGVSASGSDTFGVLSNKINQINTRLKFHYGRYSFIATPGEVYKVGEEFPHSQHKGDELVLEVTGLDFKPEIFIASFYSTVEYKFIYAYSDSNRYLNISLDGMAQDLKAVGQTTNDAVTFYQNNWNGIEEVRLEARVRILESQKGSCKVGLEFVSRTFNSNYYPSTWKLNGDNRLYMYARFIGT